MGLTQVQTNNQTRIWVDIPLLNEVKEAYPEIKGMTYTGVTDWALRKLLQIKEA